MPSKKRKGTAHIDGHNSNTNLINEAKRKKLDLEDEEKTTNDPAKDAKKSKVRSFITEKAEIRVSRRTTMAPCRKNKNLEGKTKINVDGKRKTRFVSENKQSTSFRTHSRAAKEETPKKKQPKLVNEIGPESNENKRRKKRDEGDTTNNRGTEHNRKKKRNLKRKNKVKHSSQGTKNLGIVDVKSEKGGGINYDSSNEDSGSATLEDSVLTENPKFISCSTDLQAWPEVPSIAHFCSLFRQAFDLLEFDIQELEESLLLMGTEDDTSQLVLRLVIKLLVGCSRTFTRNITEDVRNSIGI